MHKTYKQLLGLHWYLISLHQFSVPDNGNAMPHSYLFLPPQKKWLDLFVRRMKELLEKTQQQDET